MTSKREHNPAAHAAESAVLHDGGHDGEGYHRRHDGGHDGENYTAGTSGARRRESPSPGSQVQPRAKTAQERQPGARGAGPAGGISPKDRARVFLMAGAGSRWDERGRNEERGRGVQSRGRMRAGDFGRGGGWGGPGAGRRLDLLAAGRRAWRGRAAGCGVAHKGYYTQRFWGGAAGGV